MPPQAFISRVNNFFRENKLPGYNIEVRWDKEESSVKSREQQQKQLQGQQQTATPPTFRRRSLKGYSGSSFPVLGGSNACHHCFCSPCVVQSPPAFLVGSSAAHLVNNSKRFKLYRQFWQLLKDIGTWQHPEYLSNKLKITTRDDPREILPLCIVQVSTCIIVNIALRYMSRPSVHCRRLEDDTLTQMVFRMLTTTRHLAQFDFF